jgi:hypothetical protein
MTNNWITDLHDAISKASMYLEAVRDSHESNDPNADGRTVLEKEINSHVDDLWDLSRKHPDYWEPTHETHPHLIDADGDFIPDLSLVNLPVLTKEEAEKREAILQKLLNDSFLVLIEKCKKQNIQKKQIAEYLKMTPESLSRLLSDNRNVQLSQITALTTLFKLTFKIDVENKTVIFTPFT